jgi:hypothetical protein
VTLELVWDKDVTDVGTPELVVGLDEDDSAVELDADETTEVDELTDDDAVPEVDSVELNVDVETVDDEVSGT